MSELSELASIFSKIQDGELIEDFLMCLLSRNEAKEIAGRWELVKLLDSGMSQRKISQRLGMSLCKITRGSRELKKERSAFKRVIREYL
jgi:TrpR family trp operon transcriptional repressor